MYIFYLMLVNKSFELFRCTSLPDGHSYMDVAPSERCYDGTWKNYLPVAILAIIIYAVGLPVFFFYQTFRHRHNLMDSTFRTRFGYIYSRYKTKYFWWFVLEMARKFGIILALVFFTANPANQVVFFFVVCITYMALQVFFLPCKLSTSNILEILLNYVIVSMIFFGAVFYTGHLPTDLPLTVVAVLWVVIALVFAAIASFIEFCRWFTSSSIIARFSAKDEEENELSSSVGGLLSKRMVTIGKFANWKSDDS